MAEIFDGGEEALDFGEELLIERFGSPFGPAADVGGIGAASDGGGDVGVSDGELEGNFGDVGATRGAKVGGLAGGGFHGFGFFEPSGEGSIREESGGKGAGIDGADPFLFQPGEGFIGEAGVLECVLIVAEDAIDVGLVANEAEDLLRVTAESDVADFAGLLNAAEGGEGFVDDLLHRDELDVVAQDDVEVIGPQTMEGNIDAFGDASGGEIEMLEIVATELGAECVAVTRDAPESDAEENFTHSATVEGGRIDEVETAVEGDMDGAEGFLDIDGAELLAERGGSKAEDGELEAGGAERAGLHDVVWGEACG